MKSNLLTAIVLLVCIIVVAKPIISLKPFHVSFQAPWLGVAVLFFVLGLVCYGYGTFTAGRKYQFNHSIETLKQQIKANEEANN